MKLFFRTKLVIVSFVLGIGSVACSTEKKKTAVQLPPPGTNLCENSLASDCKPIDLIPIQLGQEASAKGDVLKDENGIFSLTKAFSFKMENKKNLQIRKSFGNGNCGRPNASFIVMKGEEQVTYLTFDPEKTYEGSPIEQFPSSLESGEYMLLAFITLEQECKDMMFYYDFFLEEAK